MDKLLAILTKYFPGVGKWLGISIVLLVIGKVSGRAINSVLPFFARWNSPDNEEKQQMLVQKYKQNFVYGFGFLIFVSLGSIVVSLIRMAFS